MLAQHRCAARLTRDAGVEYGSNIRAEWAARQDGTSLEATRPVFAPTGTWPPGHFLLETFFFTCAFRLMQQ